jgi:hypothetical protein
MEAMCSSETSVSELHGAIIVQLLWDHTSRSRFSIALLPELGAGAIFLASPLPVVTTDTGTWCRGDRVTLTGRTECERCLGPATGLLYQIAM